MRTAQKWYCRVAGVLAGVALMTPAAGAQGLGRRYEFNELKQMVEDAALLVRARATAEPVSRGGDESGLVWRAPFDVVEVLKGTYGRPAMELRFKSPLNDLSCSRKQLPGKEYLLPLVPIEGEAGVFRLVAGVGFAAGAPEAGVMAKIVAGTVEVETVSPLRVRLQSVSPPYEAGAPASVRVTIENLSEDLVTYNQVPIEVRDGELYLAGDSNLIVSDSRGGRPVVPRQTLHMRSTPPPPAMPAVIRAKGTYQQDINLARFFDLGRPGVYMVTVALTTPDGKGLLRSNTDSVQIIAPLAAPVDVDPNAKPTAADALVIPAPAVYRPGEAENGLVALLRPAGAEFEVGQPIDLELRLTNDIDRPLNIDTRLERTLLVEVQEQGDSPPARPLLQHHDWPQDKPDDPACLFAHLRPKAFWGKLINANSLFGRDAASLVLSGKAAVTGTVEATYETHGMTLFSFDKPGVYRIQATYQVRPSGGDGPRIWSGKLISNPVFIRVTPVGSGDAEPMGPPG